LVAGDRQRGSLDIVGAVVATLAIGAVVYGLTSGNTNGWGDPVTLGCFGGGAALLVLFVLRECVYRAPLVPTRIVTNRSRAGAYTVMLLLGAGMLAMFYLLTLYMQYVRGYSALHTGLAYLPFVIGLGIAAGGLGPRLYAKLPARAVIAGGMFIFACGLGWCATMLSPTSDYFAVMLPALVVAGFGGGLTFVGATAVGLHGVADHESGAAAGVFNASIQVGAAVGLSALASIAAIVTRDQLPSHTMAAAMTDGYVAGLTAGAAIFALGAVVALVCINASISAEEISGH
jgi:MFS family permease